MRTAMSVLVCCVLGLPSGHAQPLDRTITTRAGYDLGDGQPVSHVLMGNPTGVVFDRQGNFYFADDALQVIHKVDASTGIVTAIAGSGVMSATSSAEDIGDNGPPLKAKMFGPWQFKFDARGILYFSDFANLRIRAVNFGPRPVTVCNVVIAPNTIATIGGNGQFGYGGIGDGGPATSAQIAYPRGIALDQSGNVYFASIDEQRVRRIDAKTGIMTTAAGTGDCDVVANGDGGDATAAPICLPTAVAFDSRGTLYIATWTYFYPPDYEFNSGAVRTVDRNGKIGTYAGDSISSNSGDGGPAILAGIGSNPSGLAFDANDNLFIAASDDQLIRRVDARTKIIETVAGGGPGGFYGFSNSDNGKSPIGAQLQDPNDLVVHNNRLFFSDSGTGTIRYIEPGKSGIVTGAPDEILREAFGRAGMKTPFSAAIDAEDNVYVAGYEHPALYKIDRSGAVSIFANASDSLGDSGDGGRALDATLGYAYLEFDGSGNLYVSDSLFNVIRRIDAVAVPGHGKLLTPASTIEHVITPPFVPGAMAIDGSTMYLAEFFGGTIWTLDLRTHAVALFAGSEQQGYSGDGGDAAQAEFAGINGITYDKKRGLLYVADSSNGVIRTIDVATRIVDTMVQLPVACAAYCQSPTPAFFALSGDTLFTDDDSGNTVYRIDLTSPVVTLETIAGIGPNGYPAGFAGDNVPGTQAQLNPPEALVVDSSGRLEIVETRDQRLRALGLVDILPGTFPNRISLGHGGHVQVAIRATYNFDPRFLDPRTISVAGAPIETQHGVPEIWLADVDGDGRLDVVFNVAVGKLQLTTASREAAVSATTVFGEPFVDADFVTVTR